MKYLLLSLCMLRSCATLDGFSMAYTRDIGGRDYTLAVSPSGKVVVMANLSRKVEVSK